MKPIFIEYNGTFINVAHITQILKDICGDTRNSLNKCQERKDEKKL